MLSFLTLLGPSQLGGHLTIPSGPWLCLDAAGDEPSVIFPTGRGWDLVLWIRHCGFPTYLHTPMDRLLNKKSKKSLDPSQRYVSLGIPTNIAVGPLGFQAELGIDHESEQVPIAIWEQIELILLWCQTRTTQGLHGLYFGIRRAKIKDFLPRKPRPTVL